MDLDGIAFDAFGTLFDLNALRPRLAGLGERFEHLLAADRVERYKPAPELYALAPRAFGAAAERMLLVSGNEWDVAGAAWAGLRTAWIARGRSYTPFLGVEPDLVAEDVVELARTLR